MFISKFTFVYFSIIILYFINISECTLTVELNYTKNHERSIKLLGNCGADIAQNIFKNPMHYITLNSNYEEDYELAYFDKFLVQAFHVRNLWSMKYIPLPIHGEFLDKMQLPRNNFVIFAKNLEIAKNTFKYLAQTPFWQPDGNYIIMVMNPIRQIKFNETILNFMLYLWKYNVIKTVLIITEDAMKVSYKIFTWLPFENGRCGHNQNEISLLGFCNDSKIISTTSTFDNRVPNDLNNCQVRVVAHIWPVHVLPLSKNSEFTDGVEIALINAIAHQARMKIEYKLFTKEEAWGVVYPNRTSTGMLGVLGHGEADIAIGGYWPSRSRSSMYDMSIQYFYDEIKFIIHTAKSAQRWKSLTTIFGIDTWILLLASYVIITLLMQFLIIHTRRISMTNKELSITAMNLFGPIFMTPVNFVLERFNLRLFFILWVFSNFFLNASYQTSLTSVLATPSFEHQVSTLDEMIDNRFNFIFNMPTLGLLETWDDKNFEVMLKHHVKCTPTLDCLLTVFQNLNYSTLLPHSYYKYESWRFKDKHGNSEMYVFDDTLMNYITVMYMTKGYPLKERINDLIARTTESGLVKHWLQMVYLKQKLITSLMVEDNKEPEPLSLEHLYGIFMLLVMGWSVAMLSFIVEVLTKNTRRIKILLLNIKQSFSQHF